MISKNNILLFCCEDISRIENYDKAIADTTQIWECHHRMETHRRNGKERITRLTRQDLKDWNIYYNRPASELIFLTRAEHARLHMTRRNVSDKTKIKISEANRRRTISEETKRKISEAIKAYWAKKHTSDTDHSKEQ